MLFAKIRSARSCNFEPSKFANLVLPELRSDNGLVQYDSEEYLVLLVKPASKQDKSLYCNQPGLLLRPQPAFFSQHFWLAIHEEQVILAMNGFLEPFEMKESE